MTLPAKRERRLSRRPARPPAAPEAGPFLGVAKARLRAVEQAAEVAAADLASELEPLAADLAGRQDLEAARVRSTGDALIKQADAIAARCRKIREWLASTELEDVPELSSGVTLLVEQMARHGSAGAEIEEFLEGMGVDRPDVVARRALGEVEP
jgi:hypothetical protein